MTIRQALVEGKQYLLDQGVDDGVIDSQLLLESLLGMPRLELMLQGDRQLASERYEAYRALLQKRGEGIPLQYITGTQWFMGHAFSVDERVLIPRPETELLCEESIAFLQGHDAEEPAVLDLCTGSGALCVSIALAVPRAKVHGADISADALAVANENAKRLGARVTFHQGDFLFPVKGCAFDLIVCNPPYIPYGELSSLQREVQREPSLALDGGADGLVFYRRLAAEAPCCLRPGGALYCEVGHDQGNDVAALFRDGGFSAVTVKEDLQHIGRMVLAHL